MTPYTLHLTPYLDCPTSIPAAPAGSTVSWDNSVATGSVVTYTCSDGAKLYSKVTSELSKLS